jgi:hypothetical protein
MDARTLGILLKVIARSCKVTPQYPPSSDNLKQSVFWDGGSCSSLFARLTKVATVGPWYRGASLEYIFQELPHGECVLTIPNA